MNNSFAQKDSIILYPQGVPGLKVAQRAETYLESNDGIERVRDITNPVLYVYSPKNKKTDAAVIICPGGGYYILAINHEGYNIGEWFAEQGITAFVLKYRLPQEDFFTNKEIRPLQDAQQAIRYVRKNAKSYKINPNKIGIMGFSAGGHLAATASTHFQHQVGEITDTTISVRPDFSILIYPVISMSDALTHEGSKANLLGKNPSAEKIDLYSNEKQVNANTPITFLVHAFDDGVNAENSIQYYLALKKHKVPSEMHLYDKGGHGFSLTKKNRGPVETWTERLSDWLKSSVL